MNKAASDQSPKTIILIDDDKDDVDIIKYTLEEMGVAVPLKVFDDGDGAISYLKSLSVPPGIIICDFNVSKESGVDIRKRIAADERLHQMCIPFILMTTAISNDMAKEAYKLPVQGVFVKETSIEKCKDQMHSILDYWSRSVTPTATQPTEWLARSIEEKKED